jgi:hypothetical protein
MSTTTFTVCCGVDSKAPTSKKRHILVYFATVSTAETLLGIVDIMTQPKSIWQRGRGLFVELLVGLVLGVTVWEFVGRRLLAFKYGSIGSSVSCATDVNQALAEFDGGLRLSGLIGAVGFVTTAFIIRIWWHRRSKS